MILLCELLQVALKHRDSLSKTPSDGEWEELYDSSHRHAIIGICFNGIERLPQDQRPPKQLLLKWYYVSESIKYRTSIANTRSKQLYQKLSEAGIRSCVLKGAGIESLYHNNYSDLNLLRQSGDIDIWIDGIREETIARMKSFCKCGRIVFHHMDLDLYDDIPVEAHFFPTYSYSWFRNNEFHHFFDDNRDECFSNIEDGYSVPSIRFNVVYVLLHIYRHVFYEGVGLRQLMDYYFVLLSDSGKHREWAMHWLKRMRLTRFAAAVMYIEFVVFGLQEEYLLCKPDAELGMFLIKEVNRSGNFGQFDPRVRESHTRGLMQVYLCNVMRLFNMVKYYPAEVFAAPVWKVWHSAWRLLKGYV